MKYINTFKSFLITEKINKKDIIKILNFPNLRQSEDWTCGDAALETVFEYYGIDLPEGELKRKLKSNKKDGTLPQNIIDMCHEVGLKTDDKNNMTINDIKNYIDKDIPVILEIQAWKENDKIKWENDWDDGHYTVAIGYTENEIILSDPASVNLTYITYNNLLKRWHDIDRNVKHIKYGIPVYGKTPIYDKNEIYKEE